MKRFVLMVQRNAFNATKGQVTGLISLTKDLLNSIPQSCYESTSHWTPSYHYSC